jgi:outer membrane protein OmpA-like peptidoglycan-associated protein
MIAGLDSITTSGNVPMKPTTPTFTLLAVAAAAVLAGCAGQPQTYSLEGGQSVTVPKGTMLGGASAGQTTALAQEIADTNNNAMTQFGKVENTQNKELATSQAALAKLEQISMDQGTGSITLFFAEGSATLDQFQYQRLVNFLDYLQRESRGRKVILVSIGSASAVGSASVNQKLSVERSQAPLPIVSQYLVNIPHQFFKVSAIGDMYAPKGAPMSVEKRYQSVRIIAAYDVAQLPR